MTATLLAKVLTASDGVVYGTRVDTSGFALKERLTELGYEVLELRVSEDGIEPVGSALREMSEGFSGVIVTTGGTGFTQRDLTPEATRTVIDRDAPGLSEAMRLVNPLGRLSRGVAGTVGETLIINTPGSTRGCIECLDAVADVLPHVLALLAGVDKSH
ncbi:MAG: molybdenum cofactor biosynthesis protein B [Acidimicrobiales bacterium]